MFIAVLIKMGQLYHSCMPWSVD